MIPSAPRAVLVDYDDGLQVAVFERDGGLLLFEVVERNSADDVSYGALRLLGKTAAVIPANASGSSSGQEDEDDERWTLVHADSPTAGGVIRLLLFPTPAEFVVVAVYASGRHDVHPLPARATLVTQQQGQQGELGGASPTLLPAPSARFQQVEGLRGPVVDAIAHTCTKGMLLCQLTSSGDVRLHHILPSSSTSCGSLQLTDTETGLRITDWTCMCVLSSSSSALTLLAGHSSGQLVVVEIQLDGSFADAVQQPISHVKMRQRAPILDGRWRSALSTNLTTASQLCSVAATWDERHGCRITALFTSGQILDAWIGSLTVSARTVDHAPVPLQLKGPTATPRTPRTPVRGRYAFDDDSDEGETAVFPGTLPAMRWSTPQKTLPSGTMLRTPNPWKLDVLEQQRPPMQTAYKWLEDEASSATTWDDSLWMLQFVSIADLHVPYPSSDIIMSRADDDHLVCFHPSAITYVQWLPWDADTELMLRRSQGEDASTSKDCDLLRREDSEDVLLPIDGFSANLISSEEERDLAEVTGTLGTGGRRMYTRTLLTSPDPYYTYCLPLSRQTVLAVGEDGATEIVRVLSIWQGSKKASSDRALLRDLPVVELEELRIAQAYGPADTSADSDLLAHMRDVKRRCIVAASVIDALRQRSADLDDADAAFDVELMRLADQSAAMSERLAALSQ